MRNHLEWTWALALLVAACTREATPGGGSDAAVMTDATPQERYVEALTTLRRAACERQLRCSAEQSPTVISTLNLCIANARRFDVEPSAARRAMQLDALARGELTYDPDALGPCLDALARTCPRDPYLGDVAVSACTNLLHGRAMVGEVCRAREACAPGLRCVALAADAGAVCEGRCASVTAAEGCRTQPCGTLGCGLNGPCASAPLLPPRDGGCGSSMNGAGGYVTCPSDQVCRLTIEVLSLCGPRACDPPCGPDAYCDFNQRRCLDAELLGEGAECGEGRPPCDPRRGLFCDDGGRCAARYGEGHACTRDACAAGLTCRAGACRRAVITAPEEGDCDVNDDCESRACVDHRCASTECFL
ncbi:MAG: hypothetical protein R3A52_02180 [Polyangiales bacterium]